ncbi:hypothetical protein WDU94_015514 [Cyamophila willieti]
MLIFENLQARHNALSLNEAVVDLQAVVVRVMKAVAVSNELFMGNFLGIKSINKWVNDQESMLCPCLDIKEKSYGNCRSDKIFQRGFWWQREKADECLDHVSNAKLDRVVARMFAKGTDMSLEGLALEEIQGLDEDFPEDSLMPDSVDSGDTNKLIPHGFSVRDIVNQVWDWAKGFGNLAGFHALFLWYKSTVGVNTSELNNLSCISALYIYTNPAPHGYDTPAPKIAETVIRADGYNRKPQESRRKLINVREINWPVWETEGLYVYPFDSIVGNFHPGVWKATPGPFKQFAACRLLDSKNCNVASQDPRPFKQFAARSLDSKYGNVTSQDPRPFKQFAACRLLDSKNCNVASQDSRPFKQFAARSLDSKYGNVTSQDPRPFKQFAACRLLDSKNCNVASQDHSNNSPPDHLTPKTATPLHETPKRRSYPVSPHPRKQHLGSPRVWLSPLPHDVQSSDAKKARSSNFTKSDTQVLLRLSLKKKHVLENKATDAVNNKMKEKVWKEITTAFNASSGGPPRDWTSLKGKYNDLKRQMRKKKKSHLQTGGGPPSPPSPTLTEEEKELKLLIALSCDGMQPSQYDSDANYAQEKKHRLLKTHLVAWPLGRDLIVSPLNISIRLRGSEEDHIQFVKQTDSFRHLCLSRSETNNIRSTLLTGEVQVIASEGNGVFKLQKFKLWQNPHNLTLESKSGMIPMLLK